jgi:uncharacterized protein DUF559
MAAGRPRLETLITDQDGVLGTADALGFLSKGELRWRIASGRWQNPCRGVVVTHSGPLTQQQMLRAVLLRWGPRAALAGLTAAWLDGFTGFGDKVSFTDRPVYLLTPSGSKQRPAPLGLNVIVHCSRLLSDSDVHPLRQPRRTRVARSLVDAAEWMKTDRGAMAVLAAGVQQGLVRVGDLRAVLASPGVIRRRRGLLLEVLGDIEGGAHALSELDFTRSVIRRYRLPEPSRQVGKRDSRNRRCWIDVMFDEWKVIVEIDGAQHIDPLDQWDDMERDNDFNADGYETLRFPAWLVRRNPEYVARRILEALRRAGYRG